MTITDLVLILFIAALLAFAIYDQFIMPRRNGPTLLAIPLLRRGRIDSVIFVGLIVILIYNNVTNHGALITTWLLSALALMGFYIFWDPRSGRSSLNKKVFSSPMSGLNIAESKR